MSNQPNRYSAEELEEFKAIIEKKRDSAKIELQDSIESLKEMGADAADKYGSDSMDDGNNHAQMEFLGQMIERQGKYLTELENALLRIKNGVYGVCVITGELIDKNRMKAVPTTTKSIHAKLDAQKNKPVVSKPKPEKKSTSPKIFTKIKQKPPIVTNKPIVEDDDDDLLEEEWMEDDDLPIPSHLEEGDDEDLDDDDDLV